MATLYRNKTRKRQSSKTLAEAQLQFKFFPNPRRLLLIIDTVDKTGAKISHRMRLMGIEIDCSRNAMIGEL